MAKCLYENFIILFQRSNDFKISCDYIQNECMNDKNQTRPSHFALW